MFEKVAISLLKGIVYKEDDIKLWEALIENEQAIRCQVPRYGYTIYFFAL